MVSICKYSIDRTAVSEYAGQPPSQLDFVPSFASAFIPPYQSACPVAKKKKTLPLCFAAACFIGLARRGGIKVFSRGHF